MSDLRGCRVILLIQVYVGLLSLQTVKGQVISGRSCVEQPSCLPEVRQDVLQVFVDGMQAGDGESENDAFSCRLLPLSLAWGYSARVKLDADLNSPEAQQYIQAVLDAEEVAAHGWTLMASNGQALSGSPQHDAASSPSWPASCARNATGGQFVIGCNIKNISQDMAVAVVYKPSGKDAVVSLPAAASLGPLSLTKAQALNSRDVVMESGDLQVHVEGSGLWGTVYCTLPDGFSSPLEPKDDGSGLCSLPAAVAEETSLAVVHILRPGGCGGNQAVNITFVPQRNLAVIDVTPRQALEAEPTEMTVRLAPEAASWLSGTDSGVKHSVFCRLVGAMQKGKGDLLMPGRVLLSEDNYSKVGCIAPSFPKLPSNSFKLEVGVGHTLLAPLVVSQASVRSPQAPKASSGQGQPSSKGVTFSGPGFPMLSMAESRIAVPPGATHVNIAVLLQGTSAAPISAKLQIRQVNSSHPLELFSGGAAIEALLTWAPGSKPLQEAVLPMPFHHGDVAVSTAGVIQYLDAPRSGSKGQQPLEDLEVLLSSAVNADISQAFSTALVQEPLLPVFGLVQEVVVFADSFESGVQTATIELEVGPLAEDIIIHDMVEINASLTVLTPELQPLVSAEPTTLTWWPCGQWAEPCGTRKVAVMVAVKNLTQQVYLRSALSLIPVYGAWVLPDTSTAPALHLLGVPEGTCPTGTRQTLSSTMRTGQSEWELRQQMEEQRAVMATAGIAANSTQHEPNSNLTQTALSFLSLSYTLEADATAAWQSNVHEVEMSPSFMPDQYDYGVRVATNVTELYVRTLLRESFESRLMVLTEGPRLYIRPVPDEATTTADSNTIGGAAADMTDKQPAAPVGSEIPRRMLLRNSTSPLIESGKQSSSASGASDVVPEPSAPTSTEQSLLFDEPLPNALTRAAFHSLEWVVPLAIGQNLLEIAVVDTASQPSARAAIQLSSWLYTIAVTRLAPASHVAMASIVVVSSSGYRLTLCASGPEQADYGSAESDLWGLPPQGCLSGEIITVFADASVTSLSVAVQPEHLGIADLAVEVGQQVLEDGHAKLHPSVRTLVAPPLPLGNASLTSIPVVVVAEDRITSATYTVHIQRIADSSELVSSMAAAVAVEAVTPELQLGVLQGLLPDPKTSITLGLPPLPSVLASGCDSCGPGEMADQPGASRCTLCSPGTFSPGLSSNCSLCPAGSFAPTWGAGHCWQCSLGTHSPFAGASACQLCPANMITPPLDRSNCSVALNATDISQDYAVLVQLNVAFVVDTDDLADVAFRTGLQGAVLDVVAYLMKVDTATVFNISIGDVGVSLALLNATFSNLQAFMPHRAPLEVLPLPNASHTDVDDALHANSTVLANASGALRKLANPTSEGNSSDTGWELRSAGTPLRRILTANLTATLPASVDLTTDKQEDIEAKVNVQQLSADQGIGLLASSPDTFFLRTTKALNSNAIVAHDKIQAEVHKPKRRWMGIPIWAWIVLSVFLLALLLHRVRHWIPLNCNRRWRMMGSPVDLCSLTRVSSFTEMTPASPPPRGIASRYRPACAGVAAAAEDVMRPCISESTSAWLSISKES